MEQFTKPKLLYSRRPPVSAVVEWIEIYNNTHTDDWRGRPDNTAIVYVAQNIHDYYKVVIYQADNKRVIKYFFGESAHYYVTDFLREYGHTFKK